jgi:hypothetical protein
MLVVAGLSLRNLEPRVWDAQSPYYLPDLRGVMVSYADFHRNAVQRRAAMRHGVHASLGAPADVQVYLDNGAFHFLRQGGTAESRAYGDFVRRAKPDWYPVRFDAIPTPKMPRGDRMVGDFGKWRGRVPTEEERVKLSACQCPACLRYSIAGLQENGIRGFCNRATHNLYVLLEEAAWLRQELNAGTYRQNYRSRLNNSAYLPLIESVLALSSGEELPVAQ